MKINEDDATGPGISSQNKENTRTRITNNGKENHNFSSLLFISLWADQPHS